MVNRHVACDECTRLCETLHQKQKDPSRIVTRFFGFIFAENNSEALYVPPKFAREVDLAANQETQIEDSSGNRWSVTLSYIDRELAFKKGWNKFYVDHDLEEGYCLTFNYIRGSHFVVQIYQRSGCEIVNFNNVRPQQNKRRRRDSETVPQGEQCETPDVNPRSKRRLRPPVASRSELQKRQTRLMVRNADLARQQIPPSSVTMDDPSWMINRDDGYIKGEDRNFLYDLSSFEMEKETPDANKIKKPLDTVKSPSQTIGQTKTSEDVTQMSVIHTNPIDGPSGDVFTDKFEKALDARMAPSHELSKTYKDNTKTAVIHTNQTYGYSDDVFSDKFDKMFKNIASSHTETMEQTKTMGNDTEMPVTMGKDTEMPVILSNQITDPSGDIFTDKSHTKPSNNSILSKGMSNDVINLHNSKRTCTDLLGNKHAMASDSQSPFVGSSKIAAEGAYAVKGWSFGLSVSSNHAIKKELQLGEEARAFPEAFHVVKVEPDLSNEVVSSVEVGPFSAEVKNLPYLELHIPPIPGRRDRGRGKVVYLRDSKRRLWPLFYPDVYSVKALTDNWTLFCQQNNIKPGDKCKFELEKNKDLQYIYRVDVTHRVGQLLGN